VDRLPATDLLAWAGSSGEAVQNEDGQVRGSLLRHPNVTSRTLKVASEEILSEQLGSDYSLENDPAASRTRAYWRRGSPHLSSEGHTRICRGASAGSGPGSAPSTRGRAGPPAGSSLASMTILVGFELLFGFDMQM
jgi:hypothetical protein